MGDWNITKFPGDTRGTGFYLCNGCFYFRKETQTESSSKYLFIHFISQIENYTKKITQILK